MATHQKPKQRIDVGIAGDANTGDIIFDGGVKLNENLDALYNTFGDQRLFDVAQGEASQVLHATGYYQKLPTVEYTRSPVERGSMHDLDTTASTFQVTLPDPTRGECVEFINSNGSWTINPIIFKPQVGASIAGNTELRINQGSIRIRFTCTNETTGSARWDYFIEPLNGDFSVPINKTVEIDSSTATNIVLFKSGEYTGIKLLVSAEEITTGVKERTISEILVMADTETSTAYSDEYSVIYKNAKAYNIEFLYSSGSVVARVTSNLSKIRFSIKAIETIKAII